MAGAAASGGGSWRQREAPIRSLKPDGRASPRMLLARIDEVIVCTIRPTIAPER
jgi:hypothetical protein